MPFAVPTAATNERNHYNHPGLVRVPIPEDSPPSASHPADHDPLRWQELGARARFDYVGNTSGPRAPQFPLQQQQKRGSTPKMMWQEQGGGGGMLQ